MEKSCQSSSARYASSSATRFGSSRTRTRSSAKNRRVKATIDQFNGPLIDGLHLFVYPLTRGAGPRLFPEDAPPTKFSREASETYDNGVVYTAYRPQEPANSA